VACRPWLREADSECRVAGSQAPGFGDFTIKINDHYIMGNPINDLTRD
jgi:hypothetical protein